MVLSQVFESFVEASPISVMGRLALPHLR